MNVPRLIILMLALTSCSNSISVDEFSQCLTEKNTKYYGSFFCENCKTQNEFFGDSKKYLNYIECDPDVQNSQSDLCDDAQINAYPTWIFDDGFSLVGVQSFDKLSDRSGCAMPKD